MCIVVVVVVGWMLFCVCHSLCVDCCRCCVVLLVVCWFASLCLLLFDRRCFSCGVVGDDGCLLFVVG